MLTQKDIEEIERILDKKFDEKFKFLPTKDEFFDRMDKLSGEIKAMREESTIHTGSHSHITDQLENHDQRLSKVEKRLNIPANVD